MGIDLLDTPLRASWDLADPQGISPEDLGLVADRLVEAGLFFLLLQNRALSHALLPELLGVLDAGGVQTTLVAELDEVEGGALQSGWRLRELFIDVAASCTPDRFDFQRVDKAIALARRAGYRPQLLLHPLSSHLPVMPALFRFALNTGVSTVKLPNLPQVGKVPSVAEIPLAGDLGRFAELWDRSGFPLAPLVLEVHDLFFWEILCPGQPRENYQGCQAGNSLAHIAGDGSLYPCISWPVRLGSLLEQDIYQLWEGSARLDVRQELGRQPGACRGCQAYHACFGGCRGLARTRDDASARDLLCSNIR